jgi:hypothetical protein
MAKMRTMYTVSVPNPNGEPTVWRGDCPRWASRPVTPGTTVTATRVVWVGPVWCTGVGCQH